MIDVASFSFSVSDYELALLVGEGKRKYIDDFRGFQSSLQLAK